MTNINYKCGPRRGVKSISKTIEGIVIVLKSNSSQSIIHLINFFM